MNFHRELSTEEEADFRKWARENHKIGEETNSFWHPVVLDEIAKMEVEFINSL